MSDMTSAPVINTIAASRHLTLLGDSVFDNFAYVPNGTAVIDHLRQLIPASWRATLLAHDGDVVADISKQLSNVPMDTSHVMIGVGGNDALRATAVFADNNCSVIEALERLAKIHDAFRHEFQQMLRQASSLGRPLSVCTIYDAMPGLAPELQTPLLLFNDTIVKEAQTANVPVIDLRQVFTSAEDYSEPSPSQPSSLGGYKIAKEIANWLGVISDK